MRAVERTEREDPSWERMQTMVATVKWLVRRKEGQNGNEGESSTGHEWSECDSRRHQLSLTGSDGANCE